MSTVNPSSRFAAAVLAVAGSGLLLATGGIHLDLYLTGYRQIPTIGWLFLLQVIGALLVALACLVAPLVTRPPRGRTLTQMAAAAGALFALGTLAGYLVSLNFALFGFRETRTTAGIVAAAIEVVAVLLLGACAVSGGRAAPRLKELGLAGVTLLMAILLGLSESATGAAAVSAGQPPTMTHVGKSGVSSKSGSGQVEASITVHIKNFMFHPMTFSVSPGEKIRVKNEDSVAHTLTAMPGAASNGKFNTGSVGPGQTVTMSAPTKPGKYPFFCTIHQYMTGTLTVRSG
ncbi:MAG: cupredoxin domain-containing protein [Acidimicrobiales bacterium]